jgi:hypothetical protein
MIELKDNYPKEKMKSFIETCEIFLDQGSAKCIQIECKKCPFYEEEKYYCLRDSYKIVESSIMIKKFCKEFLKKFKNGKRIYKVVNI